MHTATRTQQSYDYRFRNYIYESGDTKTAQQLGVPRSTVHDWHKRRSKPVVSHIEKLGNTEQLEIEVEQLKQEYAILCACLRIVVAVMKITGFSFKRWQLPEGKDKSRLLRAIDHSSHTLPLGSVLREIGLSPSRYDAWRGAVRCELADRSSCPRTHPTQTPASELAVIRDMQRPTSIVMCRPAPYRDSLSGWGRHTYRRVLGID